jgi:hypothetical protein
MQGLSRNVGLRNIRDARSEPSVGSRGRGVRLTFLEENALFLLFPKSLQLIGRDFIDELRSRTSALVVA